LADAVDDFDGLATGAGASRILTACTGEAVEAATGAAVG
jgi:hypothetical protein